MSAGFLRFILKRDGLYGFILFYYGGERGIRTLERLATLHAFQACALGHYAISPCLIASRSEFFLTVGAHETQPEKILRARAVRGFFGRLPASARP